MMMMMRERLGVVVTGGRMSEKEKKVESAQRKIKEFLHEKHTGMRIQKLHTKASHIIAIIIIDFDEWVKVEEEAVEEAAENQNGVWSAQR